MAKASAKNGSTKSSSKSSPKKEKKTNPATGSSTTFFEKCASGITTFTGSPYASSIAIILVLVWAVTGPIFDFSEAWQLVINTGTTIITFLMVFFIQHSQNKESLAIQLKLDALISSIKGASNKLIDAEDLSEKELRELRIHFEKLSQMYAEKKEALDSEETQEAVKKNTKSSK